MAKTIVDLKTNNKEERICEFKNLLKNVQRKMNNNQEAVKQKMERILLQALTNAPLTPAEEKAIRMKEERAKIRKDFIEKKCKTLHHKIVELEDAHKMSNDGICLKMTEIGKERPTKLSVSSRHIWRKASVWKMPWTNR